MPTNHQIDAPQTLIGLFPPDTDDEDNNDEGAEPLTLCYEIQSVELVGRQLSVRQFDFHSHNANRVWPGTFNLADYLFRDSRNWGNILELGAATGLLSIRLAWSSIVYNSASNDDAVCNAIVTSDVQDDGEIASNIAFNFHLNQIAPPPHVPHTWGTGWMESVSEAGVVVPSIDTIVASDILLYVAAYPALVTTLSELMVDDRTVFVMSWNRRMKESTTFFDMMKEAGFHATHEGKCVYTFIRRELE